MKKEELKRRLQDAIEKEAKGKGDVRLRLSCLRSCPRLQYFRLFEGEEDEGNDLEKLGHFLKGKIFEGWLKGVLLEAECQREVNFFGILGHIDFFIPPDTALEVKTTSQSLLGFVPNYEHLWQVKAYLAGLRYEGVENPKGLLLYIPADNPSKMLEHIYEVKLEENDYKVLEEQARLLKEAEKAKEPPPIPSNYNPDKLPCSGSLFGKPYLCPFLNTCWDVKDHQILPQNLVDQLGEIWERKKKREEEEKLLEEYLGMVKERLKSDPQLETVKVEGKKYRLVAVKTTIRIFDFQKMKETLGKEFEDFKRGSVRVDIEFQRIEFHERRDKDATTK